MKTKNMIWAALSMTAALVMTACTNDDNVVDTPAAPQAEVKTIPYTVTVGQGGDATTRATVDSDNKTLRFAAGDKLYILSYNHPGGLKGILTLKAGDEGKTSGATFEGTISYGGNAPADDTPILATLVGTSNVNFDIVDDKVVGGIPSSAYYDNVKEAVEKYSYLTGMSTYGEKEFTLVQIMAFLNFEITFEDGTAAGTTLNTVVSNGGLSPDPYCSANVTTKTEGGKVVAKFVLPVAAGATLSGATVKMGDKAALTINDATLDGKVYNISRSVAATPVVPDGAISGQFTINSNGDKVYFSKGNLQYQASTNTWRFAEHQYDIVGGANSSTSSSYSGWIDLFGWGTSNKTFDSGYGSATQPWSTITSGPSYGPTGTSNGLYGAFANGDWGVNMTGTYTWRTLTGGDGGEWIYIFNSRASGATVNGNSNARYAKATINTDGTAVNGIILFPDGCKINSSSATTWGAINNASNNYTTKCTTAQWSHLEELGCVFLPATGYRDGTAVTNLGSYGYYWSSSPYASHASKAHIVYFSSGDVLPASNNWRDRGHSVRLVHDVPAGSQGTQANDRSYGDQSDLGTW